jgi:hypothetical protein
MLLRPTARDIETFEFGTPLKLTASVSLPHLSILALVSSEGDIVIVTLTIGVQSRQYWRLHLHCAIEYVAFNKSGSELLAMSRSGSLFVLDLASRHVRESSDLCLSAPYCATGTFLCGVEKDHPNSLVFIDIASLATLETVNAGSRILHLVSGPTSVQAVCTTDTHVHLFDLPRRAHQEHRLDSPPIDVSASSTMIAVLFPTTLCVYDAGLEACLQRIAHGCVIASCSWAWYNEMLLLHDASFRLFNFSTTPAAFTQFESHNHASQPDNFSDRLSIISSNNHFLDVVVSLDRGAKLVRLWFPNDALRESF